MCEASVFWLERMYHGVAALVGVKIRQHRPINYKNTSKKERKGNDGCAG